MLRLPRLYFSKSANQPTIGEAALLAGLGVQSPVQYNPFSTEAAQSAVISSFPSWLNFSGRHYRGLKKPKQKAVNVSDMLHPTQIREDARVLAMKMPYLCSYAVRQFLADSAFARPPFRA